MADAGGVAVLEEREAIVAPDKEEIGEAIRALKAAAFCSGNQFLRLRGKVGMEVGLANYEGKGRSSYCPR